MGKYFSDWFKNFFSDTEVIAFWMLLIFIILVFALFGNMLAPVLVSIVIAYLLQPIVAQLERYKCIHPVAVVLVYVAFLSLVIVALIGLLPLLWHQLTNLINELPNTIGKGQAFLFHLPERYPHFISDEQAQLVLDQIKSQFTHTGQFVISALLASIPNVLMVAIYLVLVPLLIYFFLMDRGVLIKWCMQYLPKNKTLIKEVWKETYAQTGNYVRGKVLEMLIVWIVSYATFWILGLQYAMLLSTLVGISVIIPYIGAVAVTVPIMIVGLLQWGWSTHFATLVIAYAVIITLDANILVPLLFSEVVKLHPVAIIIAILIFGGLWGLLGVFFAIPLASLVKAILRAFTEKRLANKS